MNWKQVICAAAALSAGTLATQAQPFNFGYTPTDILVGFRQFDNQPEKNLTVNIGSYSLYKNATAGFQVNPGDINLADLTALYGDLDNLSYSVGGSKVAPSSAAPTGISQYTLWISRPAASAAPSRQSNQSAAAQRPNSLGTQSVAQGVDQSNTATVVNNASANYDFYIDQASAPLYSPLNENNTGENFTGSAFQTLKFYEVAQGTGLGTLLGTFEFQADGDMFYTPVPEPATYGLLAGLGVIGMALRRKLALV